MGNIGLSMTDPNIANGNWVHGALGTQYGATPVSNTDLNLIKAGSLYPYVNNVAVYKCIADNKTVKVGGVDTPVNRSLSMNGWLHPIAPWNTVDLVYMKLGDITRPAPVNCWVFIDENPATINDGFFVCDPTSPDQWVDLPASYHNRAGGLSYGDGHAEIHKWTDPMALQQTQGPFVTATPPYTDLKWLQERSSAHK
jgi:hypothetical protein